MSIAENLGRIRERMDAACRKAGRDAGSARLMAVSKMHSAEAVAEAFAAGQRLFGENRVQEFEAKLAAMLAVGAGHAGSAAAAEYHLIGPLQSNKSAKAARFFCAVDTLDSMKLAERLDGAAGELGKRLEALVEIKLSHEASKHGLAPDSAELEELLERLPSLANLKMRGVMMVPPWSEDAEEARPYFRRLSELRDDLAARHPGLDFGELSMGMSHDFAVAIEEGSTCVRIGTAIFGKRPARA